MFLDPTGLTPEALSRFDFSVFVKAPRAHDVAPSQARGIVYRVFVLCDQWQEQRLPLSAYPVRHMLRLLQERIPPEVWPGLGLGPGYDDARCLRIMRKRIIELEAAGFLTLGAPGKNGPRWRPVHSSMVHYLEPSREFVVYPGDGGGYDLAHEENAVPWSTRQLTLCEECVVGHAVYRMWGGSFFYCNADEANQLRRDGIIP
jgi:hypothetical protein